MCNEGHNFCKLCIVRSLSEAGSKCPVGRAYIFGKDSLVPNLRFKTMLQKLQVRCPTKEDNAALAACDWTGELWELPKHKKVCPMEMVECENPACQSRLYRFESASHETNCPFRLQICDDCGESVCLQLWENHNKMVCPRRLIACPSNCKKSLRR